MKINNFSLLFIMLLFLGLTNSCKKHDDVSTEQGANEIWLEESKFNPVEKIVKKGTTVTWVNKDSYNHTVTSNTGLFDSGNFGKNESFSYKFDSIGVFNYSCGIHLMMTGKVIVNQ